MVGYLLSRGADEAALDSEGRSALECAREWAHWSCVAVLEDAARARVLRRARRMVDMTAAIKAGEGAEVLPAVEVDATGLAGAVAALVVEVGGVVWCGGLRWCRQPWFGHMQIHKSILYRTSPPSSSSSW